MIMSDITKEKNEKIINIYVVCHKPAYIPDIKSFRPIQAGAALSDTRLEGMQQDDEGTNISGKNKSYCELTAQYWAWKNADCDYYGFFHYRRYFSFNTARTFEEDGWGNISVERITQNEISEFELNDKHIQELIPKFDIITVKPRDINTIRKLSGDKKKNNYNEYGVSDAQHIKDLNCALQIIAEDYPQYKAAAEKYMHDDKAYECNMFIMSRKLYFDYCEWLFGILSKLEQRIDVSCYNQEEMRVIGFIAERLFGIYYTYLKSETAAKSLELQKILIRDTEPPVRINPIAKDYVPIVLAANNGFVPYLSVMIQSVIENADKSRGYDIVILHRDISADNQHIIRHQAAALGNFSIRFADVRSYFDNLKLFVEQHLSVETYYRLAVQDLMPDYDKILYLDSDMVAEKDVAQLYDIEADDGIICAVKDIDIAGQAKSSRDIREYIEKKLGLHDPFKYFQAGVLVINLGKLRRTADVGQLLKLALSNKWHCHDQDVLNKVCRGQVTYLPQQWNVLMLWNNGVHGREDILKKAPAVIYDEYKTARRAPYIVHFAGYQKPWNDPMCDMAQYFWKYARKSPYYEAIVMRLNIYNPSSNEKGISRLKGNAVINALFPLKTRRREIVKKFMRKLHIL